RQGPRQRGNRSLAEAVAVAPQQLVTEPAGEPQQQLVTGPFGLGIHSQRTLVSWRRIYLVSTISSTSTGDPSGSSATPTAERACCPESPKISPNSSEAPLITDGCAVNPSAEDTNPSTLTIRSIESTPTKSCTAAMAFSAAVRAYRFASSRLTSPPTLPVAGSEPATSGSCPEVNTWVPLRTAGT